VRVCSGPGCLRAVGDDVRFCDECKPTDAPTDDEIRTHTSGYDKELDNLRKSLRWQRLRVRVINSCPLCARCQLSISEIVDHIVPAREAITQARLSGKFPTDRNAGYFFKSNLQGLCRPCHYTKTLEDKTHTGPWDNVVDLELISVKRVWVF
jgi:5-methylcytosine-specific restriction endonuclease McrA